MATGIISLIIIVLVIIFLSKKKKRTIILGQEIADAAEKERQRLETGNYSQSPLKNHSYSKWKDEQSLINPIENELDSKIIKLCDEFKNYSEEKRNEIRRSINQDEIYTLLVFIQRATLFGVRKNQPSYIHSGFIAVSMIESERCDYRDVLVSLSFLGYGLEKLDINKSEIFNEALKFSEGKTHQLIQQFAVGRSKQNSIEMVGGYTAIETAQGISFIRANYEKYNPKHDLVKTLFDISDSISGDKYDKGDITIGEKVAPIWLNADKNRKIEVAISNASGCASLRTKPKKEFNQKNQMLLIYLAEFNDKETLQLLIQQVNSTIPTTFARLSFEEGNMFCIVIQRAIMVGV